MAPFGARRLAARFSIARFSTGFRSGRRRVGELRHPRPPIGRRALGRRGGLPGKRELVGSACRGWA
eukprot:1266083-Lingulodinium_polyedra.AAC.1